MPETKRILDTVTHYADKPPCKTSDEMAEVCCAAADELPCCEETGPWTGYGDEEVLANLGLTLDENGFDQNGRKIQIDYAQRQNPCGETSKEYQLDGHKCCDRPDYVAPMFYDEYNPEVMADDSDGLFHVTNGIFPLTFKSFTENVYFDAARTKTVLTVYDTRVVRVYTGDICGTCKITVEDYCGNGDTAHFRATDGQWVTVENRYWDYYDHVPWSGEVSCSYSGEGSDPGGPSGDIIAETVTSSGWTRQSWDGVYRFTELVNKGSIPLEYSTYSCDPDDWGPRDMDWNIWPPCVGVPSTFTPYDCSTTLDCVVYNGDEPCCWVLDDGLRMNWIDRYGVMTCGTAWYHYGYRVYNRKWEAWDC